MAYLHLLVLSVLFFKVYWINHWRRSVSKVIIMVSFTIAKHKDKSIWIAIAKLFQMITPSQIHHRGLQPVYHNCPARTHHVCSRDCQTYTFVICDIHTSGSQLLEGRNGWCEQGPCWRKHEGQNHPEFPQVGCTLSEVPMTIKRPVLLKSPK